MSGIYLHIPYCNSKCIYCDFYSVTEQRSKPLFIEALLKEIDALESKVKHLKFDTIYFGGGTPTLLSYDELAIIFGKLFDTFNIDSSSEISIEANPGTLNEKLLLSFRKLPLNRISLGVQSFSDDDLKFLSRIHNSNDAIASIRDVLNSGFENISIDLISGLPSQTIQKWIRNIEIASSLKIKHISVYSLTYETNTKLGLMLKNGSVKKVDNETEAEIYLKTIELLNNDGFIQYEVSNFAKKGYECRHNLKYWNLEQYIGLGPSAASYIDNHRLVNVRNLDTYITNILNGESAVEKQEYIDTDKSAFEFIFLGLRSKGINFGEFERKFGYDFMLEFHKSLTALFSEGLAVKDNNTFKLTPKGYALCDEIISSVF